MTAEIVDGKYQLISLLGKGGMGAVYEARHVGTGRRVAVKVILSSGLNAAPELIRRFQREARASGAIESDHVVQVLDTGIDPATENPYMVMELLNGEDVQQLTERVGAVDQDVALRILAQACVGLQRAHEAGIIHRDIKSANLFLSRRDSGEILVKLLDFGIAKVRVEQFAATGDHALTRTGSMMGSPLYMSPEQAQGAKDLDHRSDIWSLGVVLYEALTGEAPHADCPTLGALIVAICSRPVPSIQDRAHGVRPEIAAIVHKALALDPSERFQSAGEMHTAIAALLPDAGGLHESMFVGMPNTVRAPLAARFASTAPAPMPSEPGASEAPSPLWGMTPSTGNHPSLGQSDASRPMRDARLVASTADGFGDSEIIPVKAAPKSPLFWVIPLGVALALGALFGAMLVLRGPTRSGTVLSAIPGHDHSAEPTNSQSPVVVSPSAAPSSGTGEAEAAPGGSASASAAPMISKIPDHAASAKTSSPHPPPTTTVTRTADPPKTAPTVQRTFE